MSYQASKLVLSQPQMHKLIKGGRIRITGGRSGGSVRGGHAVPVYLTKTQHGRLHKALRLGKGAQLQFSQAQARHHLRHGGGIWSSLKDLVSRGAKAAWSYIKPKAHEAAKKGLEYAKEKAREKAVEYSADLTRRAADYGSRAMQYGNQKVDKYLGEPAPVQEQEEWVPPFAGEGVLGRRRRGRGVLAAGYGRGVLAAGYGN